MDESLAERNFHKEEKKLCTMNFAHHSLNSSYHRHLPLYRRNFPPILHERIQTYYLHHSEEREGNKDRMIS